MGGRLANCEELANAAADKYHLPRALFFRIITIESSCDPIAHSPTGNLGLGQLGPAVRSHYGVQNVYDPVENLDVSAHYFRDLWDEFKTIPLAVAGYHAGAPNVRKAKGQIPGTREPIPGGTSTVDYVKKVLRGLYDVGSDNTYIPGPMGTQGSTIPLAKLAVNPAFRKALILGTVSVLIFVALTRGK